MSFKNTPFCTLNYMRHFLKYYNVINIFVCKMKTSDLNYFKNFQIVNWTVIREIIYYFNV